MKTYYIDDLDMTIKFTTEFLKKDRERLAKVEKEIKARRPGTKVHNAALEKKQTLDKEIIFSKKRIAKAKRLLKHPEVIRRNAILSTIKDTLENEMGFENSSVWIQMRMNDINNGSVSGESKNVADWDYHASSCRHPKIWHNVKITVNPNWDRVVQSKGLEFLGGMLTLDAKPAHKGRYRKALEVADKYGIELYEATWLRKGRGYQVETRTGFIAVKRTKLGVISHTAYHSDSAMAAVNGAHRKFQNVDDLPLDARDVPSDAVATWADTEAVGACHDGVVSWCNTVGIDHTKGSVPLIDVVRGYYKRPAPEARAIILRVLKSCPRKDKAA